MIKRDYIVYFGEPAEDLYSFDTKDLDERESVRVKAYTKQDAKDAVLGEHPEKHIHSIKVAE